MDVTIAQSLGWSERAATISALKSRTRLMVGYFEPLSTSVAVLKTFRNWIKFFMDCHSSSLHILLNNLKRARHCSTTSWLTMRLSNIESKQFHLVEQSFFSVVMPYFFTTWAGPAVASAGARSRCVPGKRLSGTSVLKAFLAVFWLQYIVTWEHCSLLLRDYCYIRWYITLACCRKFPMQFTACICCVSVCIWRIKYYYHYYSEVDKDESGPSPTPSAKSASHRSAIIKPVKEPRSASRRHLVLIVVADLEV